jgi:hypothetical protein
MTRTLISLLAGGAVLCSALTVSAQTPQSRPERPYRGIFASGTEDAQQVLAITGAVGVGFDSNAHLGAAESGLLTPTADPRVAEGSMFSNYSGGLSYTATLEKLSAGASLSSSARQYPGSDLSTTTSHGASSGLSVAVGKNTRLNGAVNATYQSSRGFTPFATLDEPFLGQVEAPSPDYGTGRDNHYAYGVTTGFTQQLSRRTALTANYDRHISQFDSGTDDLTRQSGAFRLTRGITRNLGLRLGYGYTTARYGFGDRTFENHNLDSGIDYSRDLSLTRRTKLAFSSGATALREGNQEIRYDVIGAARLSREIARTWSADLSYRRNVGFLESVLEPTFYDAITVGVHGLISRRVSFQSGAGVTLGAVGASKVTGNGFDAVTGSAGINAALTRHLALGVNYTFYRYSFEPGAAVVTGLASHMNRHSVGINLNAWAPLFQHGKRPNASR